MHSNSQEPNSLAEVKQVAEGVTQHAEVEEAGEGMISMAVMVNSNMALAMAAVVMAMMHRVAMAMGTTQEAMHSMGLACRWFQ